MIGSRTGNGGTEAPIGALSGSDARRPGPAIGTGTGAASLSSSSA